MPIIWIKNPNENYALGFSELHNIFSLLIAWSSSYMNTFICILCNIHICLYSEQRATSTLGIKTVLKAPISPMNPHGLNQHLLLGLKRQYLCPQHFYVNEICHSCIFLQHQNTLAKSATVQSHFSTKTIEKNYCILDAAICKNI